MRSDLRCSSWADNRNSPRRDRQRRPACFGKKTPFGVKLLAVGTQVASEIRFSFPIIPRTTVPRIVYRDQRHGRAFFRSPASTADDPRATHNFAITSPANPTTLNQIAAEFFSTGDATAISSKDHSVRRKFHAGFRMLDNCCPKSPGSGGKIIYRTK